jgi:choline dehydrogenase-like flavoprotein
VSVVVVGSGASAVHHAQSLLERGEAVLMLDVGRARRPAVRPDDGFEDLKRNLEDPVAHLLGERFEAVTYPGGDGEYYGFPPGKAYVFEGVDGFEVRPSGFAPLLSFARGGLAEAWTGGAFPFVAAELRDFPFGIDEIGPHYDEVAGRIGIAGEVDDLAAHLPAHANLLSPLPLDEHSIRLLERYHVRRDRIRRLGAAMGRSRVAVLPEDRAGRKGCTLLGRCLLGCPTESLWTPSVTLAELETRAGFTYRPGLRVTRLAVDGDRRVTGVVAARVDGTGEETVPAERVALAAGTLASSKIFLETWRAATGECRRLSGLMDNRQVLMPFLNPAMIRRPHDPRTYQYHQLAVALATDDPAGTIHGLVTTLKTASIHPVVQGIPLDVRTALRFFRNVHAALGLVNVNFPDTRRESCWVELDPAAGKSGEAPLRVHYEPPPGEAVRLRSVRRRFRRVLAELGCLVPPRLSHVRPMGASVHYAGTLPMTREERPFTATPAGESRDLPGLVLVDGTTFPSLPAKNLTFTLMANAARIAEGR